VARDAGRLPHPERESRIMSPGESEIRLLLVDDEVEFLQAMTPGLTRRGFAVTTVEDGHRALGLLASEAFDVVLLDVKMPGLDGV